jgi:predicted RNA binding protein YcfA (HicA-like mRNA interferase family)
MGRLSGFKYTEIVRKLRVLGFQFDRQARGSHELWRHAVSGRKTTVPQHRREMPEGTLRSILRQAGIEVDDFLRA